MSAIKIDFVIGGIRDVTQAFRTVAKASQDMERSVVVGMQRTDRARGQSNANYERLQERRFAQLKREVEREQKAVERAETFKAKVAKKAADASARESAKASQLIIRAKEREAAAVERLQEKRLTHLQRTLARELAASERADKQNLARQKRATDQALADRKRITSGVAGSIVGSAGGALRTMAGIAGTVTALGGGFSLADSVQTEATNRGKAADLENASGGKAKKGDVYNTASRVGTQFGIETTSVIEGLDAFVQKSGDVEAGMKLISKMAELATATGADLSELSKTAGIVQMSTRNTDDTMSVMREMAGMGRAGSVDLRDLQQYGGRITSASTLFANKRSAMTSIGAIVQQAAATGGATDAAEATTSITHLGSDILKKEDAFKKLGVETRDANDKRYLADPREIIKRTLSATKGDASQINELFGERSVRAVRGFQDVYNRTSGSDADKIKAVDAAFDDFAKATLKEAQVKEEAAKRMQESDKQFASALNELKDAVGKELLPEMTKLIPKIREMIPAFVSLLKHVVEFGDWFLANPLSGMGVVVLGAITRDLAAAGIGAGVKAALMALMSTSGIGVPAARAGGAAATAVGGAGIGAIGGAVAGGAAIGGALGVAGVQINSARQLSAQAGTFNASLEAGNSLSALMASPNSPEKLAKLKALQGSIQGQIAEAQSKSSSAGAGLLTTALGYATGQGSELSEARATEQAAYATTIKSLTGDLQKLQAAIQQASGAMGGATAKPGGGSPNQVDGMAKRLGSGAQ